ncbi:hypothetical protein F4821DRAFT_27990 [Hypoxylon rubiginosum]|uniref:Uncharacterized protein n=1 Tax=Hypoxylon rubiginosum TaxID=110542 RepID=A0ACC0DCE7_9PEZI|nr:hypothetical protein F4821DRAFT_27990 [Hypoxylon rubiginosum]
MRTRGRNAKAQSQQNPNSGGIDSIDNRTHGYQSVVLRLQRRFTDVGMIPAVPLMQSSSLARLTSYECKKNHQVALPMPRTRGRSAKVQSQTRSGFTSFTPISCRPPSAVNPAGQNVTLPKPIPALQAARTRAQFSIAPGNDVDEGGYHQPHDASLPSSSSLYYLGPALSRDARPHFQHQRRTRPQAPPRMLLPMGDSASDPSPSNPQAQSQQCRPHKSREHSCLRGQRPEDSPTFARRGHE